MTCKRALKKGIEIYRQLSPNDRLWVSKELARELKPLPVFEIKRLARALGFGVKQPKLFLSHSHQDKRFVRPLARKLEEHGIGVWLDEAELNIGDSLLARISEAVYDVDLVVAVLSKASVVSSWVKEELEMAMTRQIAGKRVTVLLLLKEECNVPKYLKGKIYADFTTSYRRRKNFILLIDAIIKHYTNRAYQVVATSYRMTIEQWLTENHKSLFASKEAEGKDWVAVLSPAEGSKKPEVVFFHTKKELSRFMEKATVCACSWRNAHSLELMY